jgi:hypothetical protein
LQQAGIRLSLLAHGLIQVCLQITNKYIVMQRAMGGDLTENLKIGSNARWWGILR